MLEDTDVPELQPDYINDQLKEASNEVVDAGKEVAVNPDNADQIISQTLDSLQQRADKIGDAADKDAIANAVNKNSDLNQQEAKEATDNIYNGLQNASKEAQVKLDQASQELEKAQQELDQKIKEARVKADQAADATAKASIWGFVALILGMIITSAAGLWGSNVVRGHDEEKL